MFVGMTFMLFSCNNPKSSSTSTNYGVGTYDSTALHVALVPNHDCLPIYYAKRMGIYDSLGLKLQIYTYASQMDCDTMLMSRYADGGWADKIRIAHYGKRMANLEVMWTGNQHWQLFSCGALRINHIKALSGRTIAIARTSAENVWLDQILKMGKLSADDVYRPQINNLKLRAQMLTGNQIDAAVLTWPYSSYALFNFAIAASISSSKAFLFLDVTLASSFFLASVSAALRLSSVSYTFLSISE